MIGIYKITNIVNGKCYIGQSKNIAKRWQRHKVELKNNKHGNEYLQRAYNKYGADNFKFEVIEECTVDIIDDREKHYIEHYDSLAQNNGYNLLYGGPVNRGANPLTKIKMHNIMKGKKFTAEHLENLRKANKAKIGKYHISEEQKARMSKDMLGKYAGEKNVNAIISNKEAEEIILFLYAGHTDKEAVEKFSVTIHVINGLRLNRTYTDVCKEIRTSLKAMKQDALSIKIQQALQLYSEGYSQNQIAHMLHISRNTLRRELSKK